MLDSDSKKILADVQKASGYLNSGRRPDALLIYHDVSKSAGSNGAVQFALGQLCEQFGDVDQAITHYNLAVEDEPDQPRYLSSLGIAHINSGDSRRALEILERALELDPAMTEVLHGLGVCYMRRGDYQTAAEYLEKARESNRSDASVLTNLVTCLANLNRHEEALTHAERAVRLNDSDPNAHLALSNTLTETGRIDDAVKHLEKTIRQHKDFGVAYDLLARIKKFSSADSAFIKSAEKALDRGMPAQQRSCLLFALGKMHDDCGQFDDAMAHYRQANLLQQVDFDKGRDVALLKAMKKAFNASTIKSFAELGHRSSQPVFIVGMPRSGTTLMERIIASHTSGAGSGELPALPRVAEDIFPVEYWRSAGARARAQLTADNVNTQAEVYLNALRQGHPDAQRIVDKMPSNFFFVGLIASIFPNATIIHAIRHPLDTCLSCYFQNFSDISWANSPESIAQRYSLYREAMRYWHSELPEGKILDVHYEQLVDDPEHQARRMIEACGLEWESSVLEFFRKKSVVKTASVAQTRQPIYKSSKARWVNYSSHIGELTDGLAEFLQEDASALAEQGIQIAAPSALNRIRRWLK